MPVRQLTAIFKAKLGHDQVTVESEGIRWAVGLAVIERKMTARRRLALAITLSLAGHGLVGFIMLQGLKGESAPVELAPVSVEIIPPPLQSERIAPPQTSRPAARTNGRLVDQPTTPSGALPTATAGVEAPAEEQATALAPEPRALDFSCRVMDGRNLAVKQQLDCKVQLRAFLESRSPPRTLGTATPAEKKQAWEAVIRRQESRRAPISRMGNAVANDCPQSNLGTGCAKEMVLPLIGKKF